MTAPSVVDARAYAAADGVTDDTAGLQRAIDEATAAGAVLYLGGAGSTYLVSGTLLATAPLHVTASGAVVRLADGTIANTDASPSGFTPVLRVQGVSSFHLEGVTFDGNRDGQTYPETATLIGRGSRPWRHNATVEFTPGADDATRSRGITVQRCRFVNGYLSGLSTWQCSEVTVRDNQFLDNTWSGAVGCWVDGYLFDGNRGRRNGVSTGYPQSRQDGDRATVQLREYDRRLTAETEGLPTVPAPTSQLNQRVVITANTSVEDGVSGVFVRACRDARISGNHVTDPGFSRPASAGYHPGGIWFEWGQALIDHNVVWCPTSRAAVGEKDPDGIVCYTFAGEGVEPIALRGSYQSTVSENVVYCGQEFPAPDGTGNADRRTNLHRGIRVNTSVHLLGNTVEGVRTVPVLVVDDANYQRSAPFDVHVRNGLISNFLGDAAIEVARFGAVGGGGRFTCRGVRIQDGRSRTAGATSRALISVNRNFDGQLMEYVDISGNSLDCTNAADPALPYAAVQYRGLGTSKSVRLCENSIRGSQRGIRVAAGASVMVDGNLFVDCSRAVELTQTDDIGLLSIRGNTATGVVAGFVDGAFNGRTIRQLIMTGNTVSGTASRLVSHWTPDDPRVARALLHPNLVSLGAEQDLRRTVTESAPTFDAWHQGEIVRRTDGGSPSAYLAVTSGSGAADWVPLG